MNKNYIVRDEAFNEYVNMEYKMTAKEFMCIDWTLEPRKKRKKFDLYDDITQLNCYFKSEYGMNYKEYKGIIPDEKVESKKRILHK